MSKQVHGARCVPIVASLTCLLIPSAWADSARTLTDPTTGCKIEGVVGEFDSMRWTGSCDSGLASGPGEITWISRDRWAWRTIVGPTTGVLLNQGKLSIDESALKTEMRLLSCNDTIQASGVLVGIDDRIDATQKAIVNLVLKQAADYARQNCPGQKDYKNISVVVFQNSRFPRDVQPPLPYDIYIQSVVRARNYSRSDLAWEEFENRAAAELEKDLRKQNQQQQADRQKQAEEAKQKKANDEREQFNDQAAKIRESYFSKLEESGVGKDKVVAPPIEELSANPFAWTDRAVWYEARFLQMRSSDTAVFKLGEFPLLVEDVPANTFVRPQTGVIAGKVIGNAPFQILGTEQMAPLLSFLEFYSCRMNDCSDFNGRQ